MNHKIVSDIDKEIELEKEIYSEVTFFGKRENLLKEIKDLKL